MHPCLYGHREQSEYFTAKVKIRISWKPLRMKIREVKNQLRTQKVRLCQQSDNRRKDKIGKGTKSE